MAPPHLPQWQRQHQRQHELHELRLSHLRELRTFTAKTLTEAAAAIMNTLHPSPLPILDQNADFKIVKVGSPLPPSTLFWSTSPCLPLPRRMHRCCGVVHTNLKPENVLIFIGDVESIISSELATSTASSSTPPTRLVGVPPSKGRGANQTPRSESIFITGSQPLLSTSWFGSSPMLDKWASGMSKIEGEDNIAGKLSTSAENALTMNQK